MPIAAIAASVDALAPDIVAFLRRLVRTPSLADQEAAVQDTIAGKLRELGLVVDQVPTRFDELRHHPAFNDDGFSPDARQNVVGRWKGTGGGRSLILNGHVDVVSPGDEALWDGSPWSGDVRDGKLYGRGSCDMKAGLTAGIFAVAALQRAGARPAGDVLVESVIGEESGGVGTLTTIVKRYTADAALVLEPTRLELCPVQSGALTFRLIVPGLAAHAAMKPKGVSAIAKFAALHIAIEQLERARHAAFSHPLYEDPGSIAPISVGTVRGGLWHSTVPEAVVAEGRMGVFPGESVAGARLALEATVSDAAQQDPWLKTHPPRIEWFEGQFASAQTPVNHPFISAVARAHEAATGTPAAVRAVTYGSDMRFFVNDAGIPATHYGPGDVALAHAANEYVEIGQVLTATKVVAALIADWCAAR